MDGWDEADEPQGWGEDANAALLDAVDGGLAALRRYAEEVAELGGPTDGELGALLGEAEREADLVPGEDARLGAWAAVGRVRAELGAAPAALVAA